MPNRVNGLLLGEYRRDFTGREYLIAIGYEGMDVAGTDELRGTLAKQQFAMKFVKNRIVDLAFKELGVSGVGAILKGQCAFVYGDDPVAMARVLKDFAKDHKQVVVRGAVIEGTVLAEKAAMGLADAASKEELKRKVAGAVMGPGAQLAAAVLGPGAMIAGAIKAHMEKLEKGDAA